MKMNDFGIEKFSLIDKEETQIEDVLQKIEANKILLQFSCGKDSIACWLALRDKVEIVPYFMYLIPGLEFVEESVCYYERFFNTRIMRVPHPSLYRMLNNLVFIPPERIFVLEHAKLPNFTYDHLEQFICEDLGESEKLWSACGVRAADSLNRRMFFKSYGNINWKRKVFYPIWDWKMDQLKRIMLESEIKLPIDYDLFGMSFDGIDFRFIYPIKKHFPRDYERILEFFPLAELEIFRHEKART